MRRLVPLMLLVVCVPLALWALLPVPSGAQSAGEIQRKIDQKQSQIQYRKGRERVLTSDISRFSQRIDGLQSDIARLQNRQNQLEVDLANKRAELAQIQADLRKQRLRLQRLKARLAEARTALAQRLRVGYMDDRPDIVTVVLEADGFADLLERGEFLRRIQVQDRQVVTIVRDAKSDATSTAARLTTLESRQRRITYAVEQRRNEIRQIKQGLIDTRVGFDSTRAGKRRALMKVRGERHQLEGNLSDLKEQQAKISAALTGGGGASLPAGDIKRGSGALIWPVNGPITSPFCESRAWESCHPGIDIGVPSGTPIRAAAAGRVALLQSEGASGGYGNFTCVQHTQAMATCYAHQSRFGTSMGAKVSQGQVIGYSGCTGRCFGDHLHFEVRINGAVTNPMNYL